MFTQFKNYVEGAVLPIVALAGTGAISGMAGGIAALSASNFEDAALGPCSSSNINTMLHTEIIGAVTGLASGIAIGMILPASQMIFSWCVNRRSRLLNMFEQINNSLDTPEIGVVRP